MDYNTIRNVWGADAREVYSTPLLDHYGHYELCS